MVEIIARSPKLERYMDGWRIRRGPSVICAKWVQRNFNVPRKARHLWLVAYGAEVKDTIRVVPRASGVGVMDVVIRGRRTRTHMRANSLIEHRVGTDPFYLGVEYET